MEKPPKKVCFCVSALPLLPFLPWQKCVNLPIAAAKEIGGKTACIILAFEENSALSHENETEIVKITHSARERAELNQLGLSMGIHRKCLGMGFEERWLFSKVQIIYLSVFHNYNFDVSK